MSMEPGTLDRLVTIQRRQVARDPATGAEVETWVNFASRWAEVKQTANALRGIDEKLMDGVAVYGRPTQMTMRWIDGVDATMRVNDAGTLYQIVGTAMIGRREGLTLACAAWSHQ